MAWLNGKKTIIGSLALAGLSLIYFIDLLADGVANLMTEEKYVAVAGVITGLTGVAMRFAVEKSGPTK